MNLRTLATVTGFLLAANQASGLDLTVNHYCANFQQAETVAIRLRDRPNEYPRYSCPRVTPRTVTNVTIIRRYGNIAVLKGRLLSGRAVFLVN